MDRFVKTIGVALIVTCVLLVGLLLAVQATAAPPPVLKSGESGAQPLAPDATITLSNAPSPPTAIRPGETQLIQWQIVASTTPLSVSFSIVDLENGTLVDSQVYPGSSGLSVNRGYVLPPDYTLPFGRLFERYRIRVIYYSLQSGNEASAEANFWVTQDTGNLRVVKFNDVNGNGVRDPGDAGVPGVLFRLLIQGQTLGEVTDQNGEIVWSDVPVGSYQVTEVVPPGSTPTTPNPVTVQVAANATTSVLFGNRITPGVLEALVYVDANGNGVQDAGEPPYQGATVSYFSPCGDDSNGVTNAAGLVIWPDRCVGDYIVEITVPPGYVATTDFAVMATVTSGATTRVSFGIQGQGALVAFKFEDRNRNGVQDGSEGPLQGITMNYTGPQGVTGSGQTTALGTVQWPERPAGSYTVTEVLPPFFANTTPISQVVTVQTGQVVTATFGNVLLGNLRVCKFDDRNGNGQRDPGEPGVPGISVSYLGESGATGTGVTGADGCYTWQGVDRGRYAVAELVPPNCQVTTSPYPPETTVSWAQTASVQIGNRCLGELVTRAFEDLNGNGLWDGGEPPLGGVAIAWLNEFGESGFDVTDASGVISWSPLAAGVYTATATTLPDYTATTPEVQVVTVTVGGSTVVDFGQRRLAACVDGYKVDDFHIGLPGWTIRAQLADGSGPVYSQVSDGTGYFRFTELPLGVYRFWEELQGGWVPVTPAEFQVAVLEPGDDCLRIRFKNKQATPTPPPPTPVLRRYLPLLVRGLPGRWDQRSLAPADATPTPQGAGCVAGTKVDDLLVGLPGWTISLQGASGPARLASTDGLGQYRFDGVLPGSYVVSEVAQTGWAPVSPTSVNVTVVPGGQCAAVRFQNRQATPTPTPTSTPTSTPTATPTATPTLTPTPQPVLGCIFGQKVDDLHVGLPGWTINAQLASGVGPVYSQVTDGTGGYRFQDLPLGEYRVWEIMQPGWEPVTLPSFEVTLTGPQCVQTRFKNRQVTPELGCIDGHKVDDLHVGLPGWTIRAQLANGTGPVYSDITDGTGYYRFDDLAFGVWRLWEEMQPGWAPVTPDSFEVTLSQSGACIQTRFKNRQDGGTPPPPSIIRNVPYPKGIAANPQTNMVYVGSKSTDRLYKISGASNTVLASYPSGDEPFGVALNRVTNKVYVANYAGDTLTIFNGASGSLLATIDFAPLNYGGPSYVAVDEALNRAYVTLHWGGRVAVIDGASNALITTMEAQGGTFGVGVHPGLQRAYVSNRDTDSVNVFDTSTNTRLWPQTFTPVGTPYALAVDAGRNRLYVLYALHGNYPDRVAVYSLAPSGASRIGTVLVEDGGPDGGTGIAVNPTTGHVFVANSARNTVTVIDGPAMSVLATVSVGTDPGMIGVNPATNKVYVSNRGDNTVQVIDDTFTRRSVSGNR